jgi:addiction module RelE/StbE family toxin
VSYQIVPSKRFLKAVRKLQRGGNRSTVEAAEEAIHLLSVHDAWSLFVLGTRWRDHVLKGDKRGIRELHLSLDDLLLYRLDDEASTVELLDIVTHEDLRRKAR